MVAVNEPIDPRVRLAISRPDDAPRGSVSTFCVERGISRKSFYGLRKRAKTDGAAAVLEPRSRRLRSSPAKLSEETTAQALQVRTASPATRSPPTSPGVRPPPQQSSCSTKPGLPTVCRNDCSQTTDSRSIPHDADFWANSSYT